MELLFPLFRRFAREEREIADKDKLVISKLILICVTGPRVPILER